MGRVLAIVVLLLLVSPRLVLASVNVDISGNAEGSKSKVIVESNVKSSTTTSQNSTNRTDIRIETNGEVKEYHGSGESVHIESGDGNNSVSVRNDSSDDENENKNASASASVSEQIDEMQETLDKEFNLLEFIKEQIDSIFTFFKS